MSDFLLVVPPDWTQLDWQFITNNLPSFDQNSVLNWINGGMITYIDEGLKAAGLIPMESTVVEAKLMDDTYFMVKLG